jgi:hypothetical protein
MTGRLAAQNLRRPMAGAGRCFSGFDAGRRFAEIGDRAAINGIDNTGLLWHRGRQSEWTAMEFRVRDGYRAVP